MPTQTRTPQPELNLSDNYLDIFNLRLTHPEILAYFTSLEPSHYSSEAIKAFEIGVSVISRLQQSQNLDFIEARFGDIMCQVQNYFHNFDISMQTILDKNLNPAKAGSFLSQAHTLINAQADKVNAGLTQVLRDTRESISNEAGKIQTSREQLDRKNGPNQYSWIFSCSHTEDG